MKKVGRRTMEWEKVRRNLKPRFQEAGITTCELRYEGCWRDNGLTWAHARKRRNLKSGELSVCVLLCMECHNKVEAMPHEEMHRIIMEVIKNRKTQPTTIPDSAWEHP